MNKYILLQEILRKMHEQQDKYPLIHDVSTPFSLVEEIIEKVELASANAILTLNIEFAIALVHKYNIEPKRITIFADFCPTTETFAAKLGINYIDAWNYNMKFDVCFANPPYSTTSDCGSNVPVYQRFYNNVVANSTTVAFICPKNMMLKMHKGEIRKEQIIQRRPTYISFNNVEDHFANVGSTFCWFIIDSSVNAESSTLLMNDEEMQVDVFDPLFEYIESPAASAFIEKYGKGEKYQVTEAIVGQYLIKSDSGRYVDIDTELTYDINSAKKWRGPKPVDTPKLITRKKMTSGKMADLISDDEGKYLWQKKDKYSIVLDADDSCEIVLSNCELLIEEFKAAFDGIQLNGFVWNRFFQVVAKHHLNG